MLRDFKELICSKSLTWESDLWTFSILRVFTSTCLPSSLLALSPRITSFVSPSFQFSSSCPGQLEEVLEAGRDSVVLLSIMTPFPPTSSPPCLTSSICCFLRWVQSPNPSSSSEVGELLGFQSLSKLQSQSSVSPKRMKKKLIKFLHSDTLRLGSGTGSERNRLQTRDHKTSRTCVYLDFNWRHGIWQWPLKWTWEYSLCPGLVYPSTWSRSLTCWMFCTLGVLYMCVWG